MATRASAGSYSRNRRASVRVAAGDARRGNTNEDVRGDARSASFGSDQRAGRRRDLGDAKREVTTLIPALDASYAANAHGSAGVAQGGAEPANTNAAWSLA
jgi:hypothetical protein